ncbi:MAG: hypothetical protein LBC39_02170 [Methanobrevibacter sp.]|jgi:hypothetical protein|nr:hypothetical protein [Candidatus Methanovirga aequatorialis]
MDYEAKKLCKNCQGLDVVMNGDHCAKTALMEIEARQNPDTMNMKVLYRLITDILDTCNEIKEYEWVELWDYRFMIRLFFEDEIQGQEVQK